MRNILTKYTTRAGLCAMALVLAAALVLAGCKQEAEPSRQETQLEKDIKALAGKGAGIHEVKADKTLTNADMEHIKEALQSLPDTVKVNLNLSSATEITSIGLLAFSNCTALASVSIPASVKSIESCAFSGCTSLTSFTIPESVTSIGGEVFSGCTSLKSVTISNNIKSIPTLIQRLHGSRFRLHPGKRHLHQGSSIQRLHGSQRSHHSGKRHLHRTGGFLYLHQPGRSHHPEKRQLHRQECFL